MARVRLANASPLPFKCPVVTSAKVGWNTLYPVGLTREQVVEAYWRVRRWKVTASVTSSGPDHTPAAGYGTDYVYAGTTSYGSQRQVPSDERGLIAPPCSTATSILPENGSTQFSFWLFLNDNVGGWIAPAVQTGGLWYPAALFNTQDYGTIDGSGPSSTIQMTLLGAPVACGAYQSPDDDDGNPTYLSGTVVIEPAEYWPYSGSDGAIYDTQSGAVLPGMNPLTASYP